MKKNILKIVVTLFVLVSVVATPSLAFAKTKSKQVIKKDSVLVKDTKPKINITLNVLNESYVMKIPEGSTVYDAMVFLRDNPEKKHKFYFESKDFSGLGSFVSSINNKVGKRGMYWLYYVNGKQASVGISKYVLKDGDVINWKQE